jgi:hypothetical protein
MLTVEQFINKSGLDRATIYRQMKEGKIAFIGKGRNRRILDENNREDFQNPKFRSMIIKHQQEQYVRGLLQAHMLYIQAGKKYTPETEEIKDAILRDVESWAQRGIEIRGFSEKSIYRKISHGAEKTIKKERDDKGLYKNSVLQSVTSLQKFLEVASHIYFTYKKPNINNCVDLLLEYARNNERYWELAAIPRSTAIKALRKECYDRGWKEAHTYMNHFNEWKNGKAKVMGAFTDDKHCRFGDWIVGDDHKSDVDKILVWNPIRKRFEKQTLRGWHWEEVKTQKCLGYVLKGGELNAEDLIISLMIALKEFGKPAKGILIDNGLGRSGRFQDFCNKAGLIIKFTKPYEGTGKALKERAFRYFKDEFDNKADNFVGSNHAKEGYHPTAALSAPETTVTFEDYSKEFASYIYGWYETRERDREINGKKIRVSIRNYYNSEMKSFKRVDIPDETLRYAYQFEKIVKYNNGLSLRMKKQMYHYMPAPLDYRFNNRKYICCYNPLDMNQVDLYTMERILDTTTGELYAEKHERIATLTCTRNVSAAEHKEFIIRHNKEYEKHIKGLANAIVDQSAEADPNILNPVLNDEGRIIDVRKKAVKQITTVLKKELPKKRLVETAENIKKSSELVIVDTNVTSDDYAELEQLAERY